MLASGARGRLVDIPTRASWGEGGTNTAAAIHNNMRRFPALQYSKPDVYGVRGGAGQRVENTSVLLGEEARRPPSPGNS
jgi:hypothetical protein